MGSLAQKTKKLQANMLQSLFVRIPFYHNSSKSSSTVLVLVPDCLEYLSSAHMSRKSKSLLAMMYFQIHGFA